MSHVELEFQWEILDSTGGPLFSTEILRRGDGAEIRSANWRNALWRGDLGSRTVNLEELTYIRSWFEARNGRAQAFRYKDPTDHSCVNQPVVPITPTTYQLIKRYQAGIYTYDRTIHRPILSTLTVFSNGNPVSPSTYTVSPTTGILTFDSAPTGTITATFDFVILVRFDTDDFPPAQLLAIDPSNCKALDGLYYLESLPLIEVRSPCVISPGDTPKGFVDLLDLGIEVGQSSGAATVTTIRETAGKWEQRIPFEWIRTKGATAPRVVTEKELEMLLGYFRVCRGQLVPLRWIDYTSNPPKLRMMRFNTDQFPPAKLLAVEGEQKLYELDSLALIEIDPIHKEVDLCEALYYCPVVINSLLPSDLFYCPTVLEYPISSLLIETYYCDMEAPT